MYLKNRAVFLVITMVLVLIFQNIYSTDLINLENNFNNIEIISSNNNSNNNLYGNFRRMNFSNYNHCGNNICQHYIGENLLTCPIDCFYF
jgi:hypothetical protein